MHADCADYMEVLNLINNENDQEGSYQGELETSQNLSPVEGGGAAYLINIRGHSQN
jgi:hypothetical protein